MLTDGSYGVFFEAMGAGPCGAVLDCRRGDEPEGSGEVIQRRHSQDALARIAHAVTLGCAIGPK